jgi:hypothetical protein
MPIRRGQSSGRGLSLPETRYLQAVRIWTRAICSMVVPGSGLYEARVEQHGAKHLSLRRREMRFATARQNCQIVRHGYQFRAKTFSGAWMRGAALWRSGLSRSARVP